LISLANRNVREAGTGGMAEFETNGYLPKMSAYGPLVDIGLVKSPRATSASEVATRPALMC
jgi:hypothetical protein